MPLDEKDFERLKEIFVTKDSCQRHTDDIDGRFARDLVRLAVIEQQLKVITWILYAIAGGVITVLFKMLFGV